MAPAPLLALLALLAPSFQALGAAVAVDGPALQVWDGRRFVTVLEGFDGTPAIVPLSTSVEPVTRAAVTARGIRLRATGADAPTTGWSVKWIEHATDERVVLTESGLFLLGAPTLPRLVSRNDPGAPLVANALPRTARQDGLCEPPGSFYVDSARRAEWVVLIPAPGTERLRLERATTTGVAAVVRSVPRGPSGAVLVESSWLLPSPTETPTPIESDAALDALHLVTATPIGAAALPDIAVRASDLEGEMAVAAPRFAALGTTATLIVLPPRVAGSRPSAPQDPPAGGSGALVDVARPLGLDQTHFEGPHEQLDIRPTMGPGAAWGDVDDDGRPDLYLVQGGGREGSVAPTNGFFLQSADGSFVDATAAAGLADDGWGMGAQFVDLDGDGALDLFLANYGEDRVFRNRLGPGRSSVAPFDPADPLFADVTTAAGVVGERWSAGVAAADPDRDGDLDLYVTGYLVYDTNRMPPVEDLPLSREDPIEMLPFAFPGERNVFWRNDSSTGSIRLVDQTEDLGLLDPEGLGMQPVFFDFDANGTQDLYVANDVSMNRLFRVDAEGRFTDIAFQTGMDDPRGGMGVAVGDVDGDLDEDLFLTNWQLEPNALYRNNVRGHASQRRRVASFRDVTVQAGFGTHGVGFTSWGAELFDLELDGDLDLFVANGYTSPDYETTGICVGQANHLYLNDGDGRFRLASELAGLDVSAPHPSRSVAACDFDRDGDVDLLVTTNNGATQLLENRAERPEGAQWLGVGLRGRGPNRFAVGARITVSVGDRHWVRCLRAGTSYLAGNPPEVHFGLGPAEGPATLSVDWPSGAKTTHAVDALSRWIVLEEPTR